MALKHLKRIAIGALVGWHVLFFYTAALCGNTITLHPHPYILYDLSMEHYTWIIDQWQQNPHWMKYSETIFLVKFLGVALAIVLAALFLSCKEARIYFRKRHLIASVLGIVTINLIMKIMIEWFVRDYRIYMALFPVETVFILLAVFVFVIPYKTSSHTKEIDEHI